MKTVIKNERIRKQDIAVIGMSGKFSNAENLDEFWMNLKNGRDCIRTFPYKRRQELEKMIQTKFDNKVIQGGYLDDVTMFEPEIFGMSQEECRYIDPCDRLAMELVEQAILDAGYNPKDIAGENVGIYLSVSGREYSNYCEGSPMALLNHLSSSIAGRLAYLYDTHGPAVMIDCACASSLLAIHEACKSIVRGEITSAIVGGVNLLLAPLEESHIKDLPILSETQQIKAFDKEADGTMLGEGGGILILKPVEQAIADGDNIHAIIKGSATNSDGRRSNGMTSPSQEGQADVIKKCIDDSEIDPKTISYIETHGTGTKLGDPIEFSGVNECLSEYDIRKQSVGIGSLKSSIGHLDYASGVANVIKTILMLKHKKLVPSLHFEVANPLLSIEQSPLYVNDRYLDWKSESVRRAGVTSLGLIGTNVHMILEEALISEANNSAFEEIQNLSKENDEATIENKTQNDKQLIFKLSARTESSLKKMATSLKQFVEENKEIALEDISYTLCTGRREFAEQVIFEAATRKEVIEKLTAHLESGLYKVTNTFNKYDSKAIFVIPNLDYFDYKNATAVSNQIPVWKLEADKLMEQMKSSDVDEDIKRYFALLVSFAQVLKAYQLSYKTIYGFGFGDIVADIIMGNLSLEDGLHKAALKIRKPTSYPVEKLQKFVAAIKQSGVETVWLAYGIEELSGNMEQAAKLEQVRCSCINSTHTSFAQFVVNQIMIGASIPFKNVLEGRRVSLPGYSFDRKSYFVKLNVNRSVENKVQVISEGVRDIAQIRKKIEELFSNVFGRDDYNLSSRITDLNFDSIYTMQYVARLQEEFHVEIPISIFFEDHTLDEVFTELEHKVTYQTDSTEVIPKRPYREYYETTIAQQRLYMLYEMNHLDTSYNIPGALYIKGSIDIERFKEAVKKLAIRHEALRTSFFLDGEKVYQIIHDDVELDVLYHDEQVKDVREALEQFVQPFCLEQAPLMRIELDRIADDTMLLLVDLHHIVGDASSMSILLRDLVRLYDEEELEPLRIQYVDYTLWQNNWLESDEVIKQRDFWLDLLSGNLPRVELPSDYARPVEFTGEGRVYKTQISKELTTSIEEFCKKQGVSPFMMLFAAYNVLLCRMTGQEDFIIGSPISNRKRSELEPLIGVFLNTIAFRNQPVKSKTFSSFLEEVKQNALKVYENQEYPFEKILDQLNLSRETNRSALFDLFFNFINDKTKSKLANKDHSFEISSCEIPINTAKYDITLIMFEQEDTIDVECSYRTDLFRHETIEYIISEYLLLIKQLLEAPEKQLSEYDLFSRERITIKGNTVEPKNSFTKFEDKEINTTIVERFEKIVKEVPSKIAIKTKDKVVTYDELNQHANQVARTIIEEFEEKETLSQVELERYKRQMMIDGWGVESQEKLKNTKVFVAGCGGSGSPLLYQLALCGFGTIVLCDDDEVELSNLNRQFLHDESRIGMNKAISAKMTINRINPNVNVIAYEQRVNRENIYDMVADSAIIFDNVDDLESKFLISECAVKLGIPHIISSMIDINSYVAILYPPYAPCFHCLYDRQKLEEIHAVQAYVKDYKKVPAPVSAPALFTSTGFACNEAIKIVLGMESEAYNKYFYFNQKGSESIVETTGYRTITYPFSQHFKDECKKDGFDWEKGYRGKLLEEITIHPDPSCPICSGIQKKYRLHKEQDTAKVNGWDINEVAVTSESDSTSKDDSELLTIKKLAARKNRAIGIMFGHESDAMVGMLGVLKSGMAYVPLDPNYPKDRLEYMLQDSGTRIVVTNTKYMEVAESLIKNVNSNIKLVNIDKMRPEISVENLNLPLEKDQYAYILYTSGSTGKPKGVIQKHTNVLHFMRCYTNNLHISREDNLTLFSSFSFDAAVMDIYGSLLNGATLFPYSIKEDGVDGLAEFIRRENITIYHSVPTVYRYFIDTLTPEDTFDQVRLIVMGGEAVVKKDVELYKKYFRDDCIFINGLGPTESTVTVQCFMDKNTELLKNSVPVGFPVQDTTVYLMKENGQEAGIFETGELVYKSDYIAVGYWNLPDKTAESFVTDPITGEGRVYRSGDLGRYLPDGSIEFMGRNDFQVKIRGYRIETGEVERVIESVPEIKQAVVTAWKKDDGDPLLIAYYMFHEGESKDETLIKDEVRNKLPDYMMPAYFMKLDKFPVTPTGKIDRKSMPLPDQKQEEERVFQAPRTELEKQLYAVWSEVLKMKEISIYDNFFLISGNSIKAVQIIARFDGYKLILRDFFQYPTIYQMARYIEKQQMNVGNENKEQTELQQYACNVMEDVTVTYNEKKLEEIQAYNEIFYKSCFYNALFAILSSYHKSLGPVLANECIIHKFDDNSNTIFGLDFASFNRISEGLGELKFEFKTLAKTENIIKDTISAIHNDHVVIIRIDAFYETIREDTYNKLHWPHALLVYGFNQEKQVLHVIEHSDINALDYVKKTIPFEDVVNSYNGYLNYFQLDDTTETVFLFKNKPYTEEEQTLANKVNYMKVYKNNLLNHAAVQKESIEMLSSAIAKAKGVLLEEEILKEYLDPMIQSVNSMLYAWHSEKLKIITFCQEEELQSELVQILDEIIAIWKFVKAVVEKYKYTQKFRVSSMEKTITKLENLLELENTYYDKIMA